MTEQTKAIFENPQLLRQKLGEFLRTDNTIKIEKFAATAQKCFAKGGKVSLGFSISWSWWSFFLGIIPLIWRKNYLRALLWWALYFVTIGFSAFILPCFYKYFIIKRFEKALDSGDEQFAKMSGTSLLAVFITLFLLPFAVVLIGLIFTVIIPRLASTRADAEIAATIANMRTLLSDASAYHVQTGNFYGVKYRDFTNVRISNIDTVALNNEVFITVDGSDCVGIKLEEQNGNYSFKFYPSSNANDTCKKVLNNPTIKTYLEGGIKIGGGENERNTKQELSQNQVSSAEKNDEINRLLLASDDEFCESGRAWLSYKTLLEHNARIDENAKSIYEKVKSVDDVPANTISNKGSVVVCSFEDLDGMSVEYVNKKINKVLLNGEWVETNDYEKTYELDERLYKFTPINKQEVQKFAKTAINNMKLIINDLQGFRSAGYYEGELMPWGKFTTAELKTNDGKIATGVKITDSVYLAVDDMNDCIEVNFNPNIDEFTGAVSFLPNSNASGICKEVLKDSNVKQYFKSFYIGAYGE